MTENLSSAIEAILFAAGDSVPLARLSLVLGADEHLIEETAALLSAQYADEGRGIRILRLDDKVQMCSAPEYAAVISRCLEQRKPDLTHGFLDVRLGQPAFAAQSFKRSSQLVR